MTYEAALKYIKECAKFGCKLGLERINAILKHLDHPEQQLKTIHIAGTNGKGSTSAMFEAVLRQAGYKTGRYNSPHLSTYRERFCVNGSMISKENLALTVQKLIPAIDQVIKEGFGSPTEFEIGTALAFQYFADQQVDIAIIEVGMGGRFDATNVLTPVLSVITHIAMDHQEYLGDTLEKIAFEKAGIIKPGVPVVIGVQEPEIAVYLKEQAALKEATPVYCGDFEYQDVLISEIGTEYRLANSDLGELKISLGLIGRHQIENSLNLIAALPVLEQAGFTITRSALLTGLQEVVWPGRLERIKTVTPLKLYLDGSHNPDGLQALVNTFQELYPDQRVDLLIGILNNRPLAVMAEILAPITRKVIVTRVPDPKSASEELLGEYFRNQGVAVAVEPDPARALQLLLGTTNQIAVTTGSLYLTGLIRSLIFNIGD